MTTFVLEKIYINLAVNYDSMITYRSIYWYKRPNADLMVNTSQMNDVITKMVNKLKNLI